MSTAELFPIDGKLRIETLLRRAKYTAIAGVDEVGRGCLAGPVVAAVVILKNFDAKFIDDIDDSKKLKADERERLDKLIRKWAVAYAVGEVSNQIIDKINILQASFEAMRQALAAMPVRPDFLLIDGHLKLPGVDLPQRAIIQGDGRSKSIGAASIVAKVYRDKLMAEHHERFPHYGFRTNKGYGTSEHWAALREHGPCELHRMSFQGVATGNEAAFEQLALEEV